MKIQKIKEKLHLDKILLLFKKLLPSIGLILVLALGFGLGSLIPIFVNKNDHSSDGSVNSPAGDSASSYNTESGDSSASSTCSVLGINLHGFLSTYVVSASVNNYDSNSSSDITSSEDITSKIESANDDKNIKAIIIEVDSSGGSPVAGEEIARAVKDSKKPVVAFIREIGASASYWAISTAGKIFASKNSSVGSIGITQSYLSNEAKNKKDGYFYEQLSSGKYKDSGTPNKLLTADEKVLFMRDINIMFNNFTQAISENRNIPLDKVKSFSDGSTVLGDQAKSFGLIDEIGGLKEAQNYLETKIGEKPKMCW